MDIIKKRWREIVLFASLIIIFISLFFLIKFMLSKRDDAILAQEIAERRYNNLISGETSEEILEQELNNIISEREEIAKTLPENYKVQDANVELANIISQTRLFDRSDCDDLDEVPIQEGDTYRKIEVKVKKFYGTYNQIKDFIDLINNYEKKVIIKDMEFTREDVTNNMEGKNLVLVLYGTI